ncbi:MAG: T9SS type A sorting domain-containing protein [Bacteroidia bacterium]
MLKQLYKILLTFLILNSAFLIAQTNLVPNPSFEIADTCPSTLDQMSRAMYWNSFSQSPDYYNTCSTVSGMSPPHTAIAYQIPLYGNAYAGFINYEDNMGAYPNYREIIGAPLTVTLTIGAKYYFSFFVSFAGTQNYTIASNKIGLKFLNHSYSEINPIPINNFAHYYETVIITDSINWTQIKGSYTADSAYQYLAIGNFFDDAHTDTLSTTSNYIDSYYFIDNVCLSTDSNYVYTNGIGEIKDNEKVLIYPVPASTSITINTDNISDDIEVFDMIGNLKIKQYNNSKYKKINIDTSTLDNGIYLLKINYQNQSIQKQIIISK